MQTDNQNISALFEQRAYFDVIAQLFPLAQQPSCSLEHHLLLVKSLFATQQYDLCQQAIEQLLYRFPHCAEGYFYQGKCFEQQRQWQNAKRAYQQAVNYQPNSEYELALLIVQRHLIHNSEDGLSLLKAYDRFVLNYPDNPFGYHNRADLLKSIGLYQLALQDVEKSLQIAPHFALAYCNKAFILNALGNYLEGWQCYEWRWQTGLDSFQLPNWPLIRWQGEPIPQGKLLIYAEQGLGDNIQFVRYAIEAKQRGFNIAVVNHSAVENLLNDNLRQQGIECYPNGEQVAGLTHYVPMMSLPHYFATTLETIPCPSVYLKAQSVFIQKWQSIIKSSDKFKIGVVWAGSHQHHRDHQRSIKLQQLLPLFQCNAEFYCLQKEISEPDLDTIKTIENLSVYHTQLGDFSDTAGLIEQLDLVITVDTSVAHLAAAMGKPTWICLTYHPDFRWFLDREDSPWYQSVKLFRQQADCQWQSVIEKISHQLQQAYGLQYEQ